MDNLFKELMKSIKQFIALGYKAPNQLTESAIEKHRPREEEKKRWLELIRQTDDISKRLQVEMDLGVDENRESIDACLGVFRQLPRQLDYYPYHWSAYYDEIRAEMRKIHIALLHIDRKYKLGQHREDRSI